MFSGYPSVAIWEQKLDLITVDPASCNQDGLCAAVCPGRLIDCGKGRFPAPIEAADHLCIRCGHCVAVCPTGSLSHRDTAAKAGSAVLKDLPLSARQCEQLLKNRRSIRNFRQKPVTREALEKLIDMARYAPTGHNSQGVDWLVIGRKMELDNLAGIVIEWMRSMLEKMPERARSMHMDRTLLRWQGGEDVILRDAPVVVVAHAARENRMAPVSCTIALAHLELAAVSLGLGCCWAGYFNSAASTFTAMQEALDIPEDHQSYGAMMVGYPKFRYRRIPERESPKIRWRM